MGGAGWDRGVGGANGDRIRVAKARGGSEARKV